MASDDSTPSFDLWSDAHRSAFIAYQLQIESPFLFEGNNARHHFKRIEEVGKELALGSIFVQGVERLKSIGVPLGRLKLPLNLTLPLTYIRPNFMTASSTVTCVTAMAISLAGADGTFARQIGDLLEQVSHLDDCDILGHHARREEILRGLVTVYNYLLLLYKDFSEMIMAREARPTVYTGPGKEIMLRMFRDFLREARALQALVQQATQEMAKEIPETTYDREISSWLGREKVSRQNVYHADLREIGSYQAYAALLNNRNFNLWYETPYFDQLLIHGDLGCGKTVAASRIIEAIRRRSCFQSPRPKLCYHYCHDHETAGAVHLLSSLILSLLDHFPGQKKGFVDWYQDREASGYLQPTYSRPQLEGILQKIIESLDRPLFIVIDGLNECSRLTRMQLHALFERFSNRKRSLKILITSRPDQETLSRFAVSRQVQLTSDPDRDSAIVASTIAGKLPYLADDARALVASRLSPLAKGSATWTNMVIDLIATREINAVSSLQSFLEEMPLPSQLSDLYDALLHRCAANDPENLELCAVALGLLAAARRSLSILELSWAVALRSAPPSITTVEGLAKRVDHQRILRLIRPFIACIDFSDMKKHQVRLAHHSVKEFVRAKSVLDRPSAETFWNVLGTVEAKDLNDFVLDICVRYLLLDEFGRVAFFSDDQTMLYELPDETDLFDEAESNVEYNPNSSWEKWEEHSVRFDPSERGFGEFFVYASCQWVKHFKRATTSSSPRLKGVEQLCYRGSTRLDNWIQQNRRPDCAVKPRFELESNLHDPLSIASLFGSTIALQHMLTDSDLDGPEFHSGTVTKAVGQILQRGDLSRVRVLLSHEKTVERFRWSEIFTMIIYEWRHHRSRHQDWDTAFELFDDVSGKLAPEDGGDDLLRFAMEAGCSPVIERLTPRAQHDE